MPWKVLAVPIQRSAFLADVSSGLSVSAACAAHGISRTTGHKWLKRFRTDPSAQLCDLSRKPKHSPARCAPLIESAVLLLRDRFGWGPQKIRAHYLAHPLPNALPSERTIANILLRHNRISPPPAPPPLPQSFERSFPNQLWQFDFKGALEINRQRVMPFVVVDDHSRYLLALKPCLDKSTRSAWTCSGNSSAAVVFQMPSSATTPSPANVRLLASLLFPGSKCSSSVQASNPSMAAPTTPNSRQSRTP